MSFYGENPQPGPPIRPPRSNLVNTVRQLTQPAASLSLSVLDRRRSHLLAWLLLVMILLSITGLVLVLIVDPAGSPRRGEYVLLILVLLGLFSIAFALNRRGYVQLSAVFTILVTICAPWGSLLVDPSVIQGDFVPLTYVIISILLASLLLHPLFTSLLAGLQLIGLILVAGANATAPLNWPSLLALIFFTSVLSILANIISQRDLEKIDHQREQLALSEAQQTALAESKTILLEDAQKRIKQLTVLHEIATASTQVESIDRLIYFTTEVIGNNLFPDNCGILLLDEEKGVLRPHPSYRSISEGPLALPEIPLGHGISGQVAQTGQAIRVGDINTAKNYIVLDPGIASELCVPVKFKDQVLGVINVESTKPDAFSVEDENLLGTVAGQLATSIEQIRATNAEHRWLDQLAHSYELINTLTHIVTHMQRALSQDEIIRTLGSELKDIGISSVIALSEGDPKSFTIRYTTMAPEDLERFEGSMGFPLIGYSIDPERMKSVNNAANFFKPGAMTSSDDAIQVLLASWLETTSLEDIPGTKAPTETAYLRLPLVFEETMLGVLWVWSKHLIEADLAVMSTFALQIASALKRARLFQEVQNLASSDPLTGLRNRRNLFELGEMEFDRSRRMNQPFSCLMLDLDHFKTINDSHGHPTGDLVLQEFAQRSRSCIREADIIGRYGGEELVIFLPETDIEIAIQVAERLRKSIANTPIRVAEENLQITVSIGVSKRDENTPALETLIARADQAMYIAKHKGRNQVAIST
jgi:diguanylate cyclase (GGDEF)-like protein